MKVAIFTDTYEPQINGVVKYLTNSIPELAKECDIVLFAPGQERKKEEKGNFYIQWIPSSEFPLYPGYRVSSLNYLKIEKLLKKEEPDIIHAHAPVLLGLQGLIAAKRNNIPTVISYHTHFPEYLPHIVNKNLLPFSFPAAEFTVKKMIKHLFKKADVVTAPTQELVEELESYGLQNVRHTPLGIKLNRFKRDKDVEKFKTKYGISGSNVILYLGRLSVEKKIGQLLNAFKKLNKEGENTGLELEDEPTLLIAGDGPHKKKLKEHAKNNKIENVKFTDRLTDEEVVSAYASADIFASASDTETFGITFIEAMYMGLPVIGVNKRGAKELITDENGITVEPGNIQELKNAMEKLLKNPDLREKLGEKGIERAKEYSIERNINETLKIYQKLIPKNK